VKLTEETYEDLKESFTKFDLKNDHRTREENLEKYILYKLAQLFTLCR
jgi:Ca2+-binding EF-hand superfamily protein